MNWRCAISRVLAGLATVVVAACAGQPVTDQLATTSTVTGNSFTTGQDLYEGRVAKGRTPVIYLMVSVTVATTGRARRPG